MTIRKSSTANGPCRAPWGHHQEMTTPQYQVHFRDGPCAGRRVREHVGVIPPTAGEVVNTVAPDGGRLVPYRLARDYVHGVWEALHIQG